MKIIKSSIFIFSINLSLRQLRQSAEKSAVCSCLILPEWTFLWDLLKSSCGEPYTWEQKLVIVSTSIKGGVGKSSLVLLLANNLASRGHRVLGVDMDLNNTSTIYYTMGIKNVQEVWERRAWNSVFAKSAPKIKNKQ